MAFGSQAFLTATRGGRMKLLSLSLEIRRKNIAGPLTFLADDLGSIAFDQPLSAPATSA